MRPPIIRVNLEVSICLFKLCLKLCSYYIGAHIECQVLGLGRIWGQKKLLDRKNRYLPVNKYRFLAGKECPDIFHAG